ncbi:MAG: ribonuclease HII [Bacteroidetes bacterium]|jgi:ribonuclease HII|nr:ribonuclease HII [Bacteroidota bacterium]
MQDQKVIDMYKAALSTHTPEYVIGIDEVGWGCIAGPLVLGCAVYKPEFSHPKVKDSKAYTTEKSREAGLEVVKKTALYAKVHTVSVHEISTLGAGNVLKAAVLKLATDAVLSYPNSLVVIDGTNQIRGLKNPQVSLARADSFVAAVSAASMLAKVTRDQYMSEISKSYPEYEWHQNKGYPTDKHVRLLKDQGVSEHHRLNVSLVKAALKKYGTYEEHHCIGVDYP